MTHPGEEQRAEGDWESIGRAAEDFARRVARDAARFAERMEEHAGEFARDVSRDWRRARRTYRHAYRRVASGPEVRRVFEDVRTVVADVLDGVDELIGRVFAEPPGEHDRAWLRVVVNHDVVCSGCTQTVAAGEHAYARATGDGREFRCPTCGVPASDSGR
jgi:hypothetical protein